MLLDGLEDRLITLQAHILPPGGAGKSNVP